MSGFRWSRCSLEIRLADFDLDLSRDSSWIESEINQKLRAQAPAHLVAKHKASLRKGLDVHIDAEIARLLDTEQELNVDACSVGQRRAQGNRICRHS